mmetsp:Transcript_28505/g.83901  ORF Transcript_28505/g.83901 Transcript_28505/m.83901 type:complete len:307 (-) Transcript_28505:52-972(-)
MYLCDELQTKGSFGVARPSERLLVVAQPLVAIVARQGSIDAGTVDQQLGRRGLTQELADRIVPYRDAEGVPSRDEPLAGQRRTEEGMVKLRQSVRGGVGVKTSSSAVAAAGGTTAEVAGPRFPLLAELLLESLELLQLKASTAVGAGVIVEVGRVESICRPPPPLGTRRPLAVQFCARARRRATMVVRRRLSALRRLLRGVLPVGCSAVMADESSIVRLRQRRIGDAALQADPLSLGVRQGGRSKPRGRSPPRLAVVAAADARRGRRPSRLHRGYGGARASTARRFDRRDAAMTTRRRRSARAPDR